jgi:hypothetical protein
LKSLLQGRKKRVKRRGKGEIVHNVHKFMKTECAVSQSLLQRCVRGLLKQHVLAEELYVEYWNKAKMWKVASQWHFQLLANSSVTVRQQAILF